MSRSSPPHRRRRHSDTSSRFSPYSAFSRAAHPGFEARGSTASPSRRPIRLEPLIAGRINVALIRAHWPDILRIAASIRTGTVTASLISASWPLPPAERRAAALRELAGSSAPCSRSWIEPGCAATRPRAQRDIPPPADLSAQQPDADAALVPPTSQEAFMLYVVSTCRCGDGGLRSRRYGQGHA